MPGLAITPMPPTNNSNRIFTNRFPAPYGVPAGLAVDPRTVASAAALGVAALLQTLPSTFATAPVAGRGKGRQHTPSSTQKSINVSNSNFGDSIAEALKQLGELQNQPVRRLNTGNKHKCYKQGCGANYKSGGGDFCPNCGTNQEVLEKAIMKRLNFKK